MKKATTCNETLSKLQHRLELILTHAGEGIYGLDVTGKTVFVNNAAAKMVNLTLEEMQQCSNHSLVHHHKPDGSEYHQKDCPIFSTLKDGIPRHGDDEYFIRADGSFFPIEYFANAIIENNEITGVVVTFIDITKRKRNNKLLLEYQTNLEFLVNEKTQALQEANKKLMKMSLVDGLTDIANRRAFDDSLANEMLRATRNKEHLTLMIADIDFFKQFNDTYGHCAGDECLKLVASTISKSFKRPGDFVARYGGEEFAIILPSMSLEQSMMMAALLIKNIESLEIKHKLSTCSPFVTVSLGLVNFIPSPNSTAEEIINFADKALYQAKRSGKNKYSVYEPS
jgi:diguanylate cyclase (GGDEF)-like protein/PAS domain S-box-containing protein